jgi:quinolinate synthase
MFADQSYIAVENPDLEVRSCKRGQNAFLFTHPPCPPSQIKSPSSALSKVAIVTTINNNNKRKHKVITHTSFIIHKREPSNPNCYPIHFVH